MVLKSRPLERVVPGRTLAGKTALESKADRACDHSAALRGAAQLGVGAGQEKTQKPKVFTGKKQRDAAGEKRP